MSALPGRHGAPKPIVSATASHPWAAAAPVLDAVDGGWGELLLGDFARTVCCEVALLCKRERNGQPQIVSVWGMDGAAGIAAQGPRGARHRGRREGGFVGRALTDERATIEALDRDCDTGLIHATRMPLTHAAVAPVRVLGGVRPRLIAGFAGLPQDAALALWTTESYASLIALCLQHPDALGLHNTRRDGLTGCLTYEGTLHELTREINRSTRGGLPLSCCFIDLDDFKRVNDRRGHVHGNLVLAEVARTLRGAVRSCDAVGRYGGDEFIAILPQTNETRARQLAERLRSQIATTRVSSFHEPLSASVGVAEWAPGATAVQLLARADGALLAAKALDVGIATASDAVAERVTAAMSG